MAKPATSEERDELARVLLGVTPDFILDPEFPRQSDALELADVVLAADYRKLPF